MFHETEEGYKIWRGIDLSVQIDIGNFTDFGLSIGKSLKLSFQWAPLQESIYWLS